MSRWVQIFSLVLYPFYEFNHFSPWPESFLSHIAKGKVMEWYWTTPAVSKTITGLHKILQLVSCRTNRVWELNHVIYPCKNLRFCNTGVLPELLSTLVSFEYVLNPISWRDQSKSHLRNNELKQRRNLFYYSTSQHLSILFTEFCFYPIKRLENLLLYPFIIHLLSHNPSLSWRPFFPPHWPAGFQCMP